MNIKIYGPGKGSLNRLLAAMLVVAAVLAATVPCRAARLKDIATFSGVRNNDLVGYGLVVGLSGTGDKTGSQFTVQSIANMLEQMGVAVNKADLKVKNVAAVMVTAKMPVSARPGAGLDVTVSSIGDATSLLGGMLLMTPLKGVDGKIYALAQGAITLGGFAVAGEAAQAQKNITTVGRIPNGAVVERGVPFEFNSQNDIRINMNIADFTTTQQVVGRINMAMGGDFARASNISTIEVEIPEPFRGNLVPLLASLENMEVSPDSPAKVVVDEKTGTIVLGGGVRLSRVAVAHGNLQIVIQESAQVSQPEPFGAGETVVVPQSQVGVTEENRRLVVMEGATLAELVRGLNAIGATPRDLISILRTLKAAGALHAELEVI